MVVTLTSRSFTCDSDFHANVTQSWPLLQLPVQISRTHIALVTYIGQHAELHKMECTAAHVKRPR